MVARGFDPCRHWVALRLEDGKGIDGVWGRGIMVYVVNISVSIHGLYLHVGLHSGMFTDTVSCNGPPLLRARVASVLYVDRIFCSSAMSAWRPCPSPSFAMSHLLDASSEVR